MALVAIAVKAQVVLLERQVIVEYLERKVTLVDFLELREHQVIVAIVQAVHQERQDIVVLRERRVMLVERQGFLEHQAIAVIAQVEHLELQGIVVRVLVDHQAYQVILEKA